MTTPPNDADKELREAIYGCAFAVETHPKDFVLRINQKGVQDLIAVIQADRQRTRQAVLDELEPFKFVEPCEPDCTPERHAYQHGQWDMAGRIEDAITALKGWKG